MSLDILDTDILTLAERGHRGWISEPFDKGGKGLRFHHPSIPQVNLLLPLKDKFGDCNS